MSKMHNVIPGHVPQNDAGYLEMMTKVIFMGGLSRQVVEAKWEGFLDAFDRFDPASVANFTEEDVERLSEDERIIRYGAKIKAVVKNAREMLHIAEEHGSFGQWLRDQVQEEGIAATSQTLSDRFSYVSEDSAKRYLYAVGEDIGDVPGKIQEKYGPRPGE